MGTNKRKPSTIDDVGPCPKCGSEDIRRDEGSAEAMRHGEGHLSVDRGYVCGSCGHTWLA